MIKNCDHVTVHAREPEPAIGFLPFCASRCTTPLSTPRSLAICKGVSEIEADYTTHSVRGASPRLEGRLIRYRDSKAQEEARFARLDKLGFNHVCFALEDAKAMVARYKASSIEVRGELPGFLNRRLLFLTNAERIRVELAQRH